MAIKANRLKSEGTEPATDAGKTGSGDIFKDLGST
jgi:hypothetical protein